MASSRTYQLAQILQEISTQEIKLQAIQLVLVEQPDFEPYSIFRMMDSAGTGLIQRRNFKDFLDGIRLYCEESDFDSLFRRLDSDGDGRISYNDFLDNVLPKDPALKPRYDRRPVSSINSSIQYALKRFFERKIEGLKDINQLKTQANLSHQDVDQIFKLISQGDAYIEKFQLKSFLTKHSIFLSDKDIDTIYQISDTDKNGKLSLRELVQVVTPLQYKQCTFRDYDTFQESFQRGPYDPLRSTNQGPPGILKKTVQPSQQLRGSSYGRFDQPLKNSRSPTQSPRSTTSRNWTPALGQMPQSNSRTDLQRNNSLPLQQQSLRRNFSVTNDQDQQRSSFYTQRTAPEQYTYSRAQIEQQFNRGYDKTESIRNPLQDRIVTQENRRVESPHHDKPLRSPRLLSPQPYQFNYRPLKLDQGFSTTRNVSQTVLREPLQDKFNQRQFRFDQSSRLDQDSRYQTIKQFNQQDNRPKYQDKFVRSPTNYLSLKHNRLENNYKQSFQNSFDRLSQSSINQSPQKTTYFGDTQGSDYLFKTTESSKMQDSRFYDSKESWMSKDSVSRLSYSLRVPSREKNREKQFAEPPQYTQQNRFISSQGFNSSRGFFNK